MYQSELRWGVRGCEFKLSRQESLAKGFLVNEWAGVREGARFPAIPSGWGEQLFPEDWLIELCFGAVGGCDQLTVTGQEGLGNKYPAFPLLLPSHQGLLCVEHRGRGWGSCCRSPPPPSRQAGGGGRRGEGRDEGTEGCLRLGIKGRSVGGQEGLPGARVSWREHLSFSPTDPPSFVPGGVSLCHPRGAWPPPCLVCSPGAHVQEVPSPLLCLPPSVCSSPHTLAPSLAGEGVGADRLHPGTKGLALGDTSENLSLVSRPAGVAPLYYPR